MRIESQLAVECSYDRSDFNVKAVDGHFLLELIVLFCL